MPDEEFVEVEYDTLTQAPKPAAPRNSEDELRRVLRERQGAYARIFERANRDDATIVLEDLATFCRAYETPFTNDERTTNLLIGRGEVYQRIVDFARLNNDELFFKYHERALKKAQT